MNILFKTLVFVTVLFAAGCGTVVKTLNAIPEPEVVGAAVCASPIYQWMRIGVAVIDAYNSVQAARGEPTKEVSYAIDSSAITNSYGIPRGRQSASAMPTIRR